MLEVLTNEGFKSFAGIINQGLSEILYHITFHDGTHLQCTADHRLKIDSDWVEADFIECGDIVEPNKTVISIEIVDNQNVYDLLDVSDTHAYTTNGVISHNCNLIYLDEFAFVENDATFYTSTYPVISSGESSRVIITSTPNGVGNMFHKLWERAVTNTSDKGYKGFRVDWWDVPGRDEEWKAETIENTSELQFSQEFENSFIGNGNTLISPEFLLKFKAVDPEHVRENGKLRIYDTPQEDHSYIMTVDVAHGIGQDYSAFSIFDISVKPFKQVAVYANNGISPLLFPDVIAKYATLYNESFVIVEANDRGSLVCKALYYDIEYENMYVESTVKADGMGLTQNKRTKSLGCSQLKDLIERNHLDIRDGTAITEMCTFAERAGTYGATIGNHDDIAMTMVIFGWFTSTEMFRGMTDIDIRDALFAERMKIIEDDVPPFGFHDDGTELETVNMDGFMGEEVGRPVEDDSMFGVIPDRQTFTKFM